MMEQQIQSHQNGPKQIYDHLHLYMWMKPKGCLYTGQRISHKEHFFSFLSFWERLPFGICN